MSDLSNQFCDWDEDDELDYREGECTRCGGDGYVECPDPMECTRAHLGGDYRGWEAGEVCPCGACGGSGLAKDQMVW